MDVPENLTKSDFDWPSAQLAYLNAEQVAEKGTRAAKARAETNGRLIPLAFAFLMPGELRIFPNAQAAEARRWIVSPA